MSKCISENVQAIIFPKNSCESRAPPDSPRPRDRAKSYLRSNSRDPRQRTAVAAKIGERRFSKVAFPETASNHYISVWLGGRALDSGQAERQFQPPSFFCYFFWLFFAVISNPPVCLKKNVFCCTGVRTSAAVALLYTHLSPPRRAVSLTMFPPTKILNVLATAVFPSCPFSSTCVTPGISRRTHPEKEQCIMKKNRVFFDRRVVFATASQGRSRRRSAPTTGIDRGPPVTSLALARAAGGRTARSPS